MFGLQGCYENTKKVLPEVQLKVFFTVDQLDGEDKKVDITNLKKVLAHKNHNTHLAYMMDGFKAVVPLKHLMIFNVCVAFNLKHRPMRLQ
jgi:hypothetical protein